MDKSPARQTILIVDDQPVNVDVLYGILQKDYRVRVALNGEQALKLAAAENSPDLILLDIMMPSMDGYEVCRRLKANPFTRAIPVVFVSALSDDDDESRGFELGAIDYITKPVSPALVRVRVRTHLALYDQNRALEDMVRQRTVELQRANQGLRQERARFEWMVHNIEDGYLILDKAGSIVFANPPGRLYLGLPPDAPLPSENFMELARRHYQIKAPENGEPPGSAPWQGEAQTRYLVRPETDTAKDFWLQVDILEISADLKEKSWMVRLRDVTEALGTWRDRTAFTKMAYHKLRTPLATIVGGLDMLAQYAPEMPPDELAETVQFALAGSRRLQTTIEDILSYLNVSSHTREDEAGFLLADLPTLLAEIGASLNIPPVAIERALPAASITTHLAISKRAVELIFWELIENAHKFHPERAPHITVRVGEVQGGTIRLQVCDDGVNLSPEQLGQIWLPFYQGEKTFTGELPGTGLGLAMVMSLVWRVGGSCRAFNRNAMPGLVVELRLPVCADVS